MFNNFLLSPYPPPLSPSFFPYFLPLFFLSLTGCDSEADSCTSLSSGTIVHRETGDLSQLAYPPPPCMCPGRREISYIYIYIGKVNEIHFMFIANNYVDQDVCTNLLP